MSTSRVYLASPIVKLFGFTAIQTLLRHFTEIQKDSAEDPWWIGTPIEKGIFGALLTQLRKLSTWKVDRRVRIEGFDVDETKVCAFMYNQGIYILLIKQLERMLRYPYYFTLEEPRFWRQADLADLHRLWEERPPSIPPESWHVVDTTGVDQDTLNLRLSEIGCFGPRTLEHLAVCNKVFIGDLACVSEQEFLSYKGLGEVSLQKFRKNAKAFFQAKRGNSSEQEE